MSPSEEGLARLVARRISDGFARAESPREMADGVLIMIGRGPGATVDPGELTEVVADLNTVAALAPAVGAIVDAAESKAQLEIVHRASDVLRHQATLRFEETDSHDQRGAALWDAACYLNPDDGDALALGRRKGVLDPEAAPDCAKHIEVQHRDKKAPWCNACGWNRGRPATPARKLGTPRGERSGEG